jgi:RNA polymerase sigma-70 factor (ECF subfamily)
MRADVCLLVNSAQTMVEHGSNVTDFIKLLTAYEVRLRAFALSIIPHWADAEEVLQEAHLVMWRKFGQFEAGTNFFAWGCRIIHLTAKDFRKRQSRSKVFFGDEFMELVKEQTVQMEARLAEREQLLNECVGKLKERQRRMLHLRYHEGLSPDEVATTMGSTVKAIYQALSRVHKLLFDCVHRRLATSHSLKASATR